MDNNEQDKGLVCSSCGRPDTGFVFGNSRLVCVECAEVLLGSAPTEKSSLGTYEPK